ncbi:MAG: hypothetical protein WCW65_00395 [Candidatus Paceibacterota bacterium]
MLDFKVYFCFNEEKLLTKKFEFMAVYRSLDKLEGKILDRGDFVVFGDIRYQVLKNCLICYLNDKDNDKIFWTLGIGSYKYEVCTEHYGYEAGGSHLIPGQFPTCKENDYEALTRIAIALFKLCMN